MPGEHSLRYHDATKHFFNRFARSLGYLDWATQPDPFRRYAGAPLVELPRDPLAADTRYDALYDSSAPRAAISLHALGEFLRCSMGLSAWKQHGASRWALRVNPSSGNLHPTETYVVWNGRVYHYAVREHAIEERCLLAIGDREDRAMGIGGPPERSDGFLVALTSIHWREVWKYGERGFRYCQHDAGHAVAALRFAAALLGWRMALLPRWSDAQLATLLGVDRADDAGDAEREEPECVAVVTTGDPSTWLRGDPGRLVEAARRATWQGRANRLSSGHVDWPIVDEITEATRYPGTAGEGIGWRDARQAPVPVRADPDPADPRLPIPDPRSISARGIILQRRSAVAFDGRGVLRREAFLSMLRRLHPAAVPFDATDWPPQVHLILFVHRVLDIVPGLYAYLRGPTVRDEWQAAMRPEFLWEPLHDSNDVNGSNGPNGLFLLAPIDCRSAAQRLACDQEIASDGFFSLGMLARFERPVAERGDWFYRRLFWECGMIGQVLYLEAEVAGGRATGIGCFYDDPVHATLGLSGHTWQSLYHFSMGVPVDDTRLTTEPGYRWEPFQARHAPEFTGGAGRGATPLNRGR